MRAWLLVVGLVAVITGGLVDVAYSLTFQPLSTMSVYDAKRKRVGFVLGFEGDGKAIIPFRVGTSTVLLLFELTVVTIGDPAVYFSEPECRGEAFISPRTTFPPRASIVGTEGTVYVAVGNSGLGSPVTIRSYLEGADTCRATNSTPSLVPAVRGPNLYDLYTPPFSIR